MVTSSHELTYYGVLLRKMVYRARGNCARAKRDRLNEIYKRGGRQAVSFITCEQLKIARSRGPRNAAVLVFPNNAINRVNVEVTHGRRCVYADKQGIVMQRVESCTMYQFEFYFAVCHAARSHGFKK